MPAHEMERANQNAFSRVAPAGVNAEGSGPVARRCKASAELLHRCRSASESATTQAAPVSAMFTAFSFHIQ